MATKRMLVDATHPEETRIVVTSGNRLEEFDFESAERRQLRGNIYLAKVTRVEPSLQAAFVEYGGNRHGFLAFSEIHPDYYQIPVADREALMRAEEEAQEADEDEEIVDPAAEDDESDGDSDADGEDTLEGENGRSGKKVEQIGDGDALEDLQVRPRRNLRKYKIQEVIKRRQVLLVQVVKEERGNKGAALTTYLSLAGRYSVLMPNTARGGGISRKITSAADRKRLKDIASDLEVQQGMGVILRTAGASRTKAEVKRDFEYLMRLWENVRTLTLESSAPCLVYEEGSLIKRTIRDLYNKDIAEVLVAGDAAYREAKDFMRMIMPSHSKNVQAYKDDAPIFSKYNIESQLDSMFHPQVTLPAGGYIVINPTEALVSIDVNSGRATKEHNIEDTALQTNLEAAEEIARQLRLRDLAGLIVIDFIDMEEKRNNRAVERKLKDCLKNDRARIQVGHISHFGLLEMSRQRIRFGVLESSTHSCPTCAGTGLVRSVSSLALMIMRAIEDHVLRKPGQSINVNMPAEVALYILNTKRATLQMLEEKYNLSITIVATDAMVGNQFTIERGESRGPQPHAAQVQHVRADAASMDDYDAPEAAQAAQEDNAPADETPEDTSGASDEPSGRGNKRRRKRRRGGSSAQAAVSATEIAVPDAEDGDTEDEAKPEAASSDDDDQPRKRRRRGRRGGRRNRRGQEGEDQQTPAGTEPAVSDADAMQAIEDREPVESPAKSDKLEEATAAKDLDGASKPAIEATEAAVEKPKRARRSRKAAKSGEADKSSETAKDADAEAVAQAAAPAKAAKDTKADDEPAEKPARKPRKRTAKPKTKTPDTAPAQEAAAPEPEPQPEEPVKAEAKPEPKPASKTDDEIVASSSAPKESKDKPKKVGWWQRRLGLG